MPCSTTAVRTATVRQNEAPHPQQKSGSAFSPKEGGGSTYPRNTAQNEKAASKRKIAVYEGENETYIEASAENSGSILYDKEIRDKPRTRRTKRNV